MLICQCVHLENQQRLLHLHHSSINIDKLGAQADKIVVVFIDDFHKLALQNFEICLQLGAESFQRHLCV